MNRKDLDRLSRLRESANDSARSFRTVYVSYLVIVLYILSIVMFREKEELFRNGSLQIAIVNFSVPIRSFFIVSPLILLALHFNLLIQAKFLSYKVHRYALAISEIYSHRLPSSSNDEERDGEEKDDKKRDDKKREMRNLLFPAPLAHMIAEGDSDRTWQNLFLVIIPIIIIPLVILVVTGVRFLAYQSERITILQFILVVADVGILWWLWPGIVAPKKTRIQWVRNQRRRSFENLRRTIESVIIIAISISGLAYILYHAFDGKYEFQDRELVQERPPPEILSAYLDTCGENRCDEEAIDPGTPVWCKYARPLDLKDRVFRDADLSGAILCAVDFELAILNDSEMSRAKLHGANFLNAELHDTILDEAELHGANLGGAKLHGANLNRAELHGADLAGAELHGANLDEAELHDANLGKAKLHGANLNRAELHGADLNRAGLHGADLNRAGLHGADLNRAGLHGADLSRAGLHGADLSRAGLHGADLNRAGLHGADLNRAELHGANLRDADLHGADLRDADLRGADLRKAKLYGADLTNADLGGADLRGAKFYGTELLETNFDYADLRTIDSHEPDSELYTQLRKTVNDMEIFKKIQDRIANANHETIDRLSIKHKYSIGDSHSSPYSEEKSIGDKYREKLATYLVDDLACEDGSSGYVAKGIARRALDDDMLGPQLAKNLLKAECPAVANMLPEQLRADLKKITGG